MPLYEYECQNGHRFEKIQKFSDPQVSVCPTCGAPVQKLMSSPAIQFKGTGWYITDYAKKDSTSAGKGEKSERSDKNDKNEKGEKTEKSEKSETKAEKTESKSETGPSSSPPASADSKK